MLKIIISWHKSSKSENVGCLIELPLGLIMKCTSWFGMHCFCRLHRSEITVVLGLVRAEKVDGLIAGYMQWRMVT